MRSKKFKIGDRVRCINVGISSLLKLNQVYTISSISIINNYTSLRLDELKGHAHSYYSTKFEPISSEPISNEQNYEIY